MTIAEQIEWLTARQEEAEILVKKYRREDQNLAAQWLRTRLHLGGAIKNLREIGE